MNSMQKMVEEFHKKYCHKIGTGPQLLDNPLFKFRENLINEEYNELKKAIDKKDLIEVIDGICDLLYVIFGLCVCMGINIEPFFKEIHESNMSKDQPKNLLSKPIKGENYFKPNIQKILYPFGHECDITGNNGLGR